VMFYRTGNVKVNYFDRVTSEENNESFIGFGPCEANKLSDKSDIVFVFTEPFKSLEEYEEAKIITKVSTKSGSGDATISPGKYGLYLEFENGSKRLYDDLTLGDPKNNVPRNLQGPWYVLVNPINNYFDYKVSFPC